MNFKMLFMLFNLLICFSLCSETIDYENYIICLESSQTSIKNFKSEIIKKNISILERLELIEEEIDQMTSFQKGRSFLLSKLEFTMEEIDKPLENFKSIYSINLVLLEQFKIFNKSIREINAIKASLRFYISEMKGYQKPDQNNYYRLIRSYDNVKNVVSKFGFKSDKFITCKVQDYIL